jgi:DNA-binding CsgD family transcriptional regulator
LPLARGDVQAAAPVVAAVLHATADSPSTQDRALALVRAIQLAGLVQRWAEARRYSEEFLAFIDGDHDQFFASLGLCESARIEADRVVSGAPAAPEFPDRLAERIVRLRRDFQGLLFPVAELRIEQAEAQLARLAGHDQPAIWSHTAKTWDELGQPHEAAWARVWLADAILRSSGSRDTAAAALRAALATAERLGAAPLTENAQELARRGRLTLTDATTNPVALDLTPRELDVLRLVAAGRTNREIGQQLFISGKTVSVHVTHLLRKLDANSRREATEIAKRTGIAAL